MQTERVITAEPQIGDNLDRALRPQNLDEFIGQEEARANLRVFIQAAKARAEAMDHILFHGPPGLGKTTLAQIIARELGVGYHSTSGPIISKAGDLAALLTNMQPRDVLFIDEIHRLNPVIEEVLYPAMEDYKLDLMIGDGPSARSIQVDLPQFTLIGATTRSGLLTQPLRERFGIPTRLNFYAVSELQIIIKANARKLGCQMSEEGAFEIANRSRGTPRVAGRLLRRVRDFAEVAGSSIIDQAIADKALQRLEVDKRGLDAQDRRYLNCIVQFYNGGPVGIETIAAALSEQRDTLEDVIEPYLIQQGFIQRTSRGRMLTELAYQHVGLPKPNNQPEQMSLVS